MLINGLIWFDLLKKKTLGLFNLFKNFHVNGIHFIKYFHVPSDGKL